MGKKTQARLCVGISIRHCVGRWKTKKRPNLSGGMQGKSLMKTEEQNQIRKDWDTKPTVQDIARLSGCTDGKKR